MRRLLSVIRRGWAVGALLLLCQAGQAVAADVPAPVAGPPLPLIVLDPGHGGGDAGMRPATTPTEKALMLSLAQTLQTVLQRRGLTSVRLTRSRDVALSPEGKQALANRMQAVVVLSLHLAEPETPPALRTYVNRFVQDEDLSGMAARGVEAGVRALPADLAQNSQLRKSQQLAKALSQGWTQSLSGLGCGAVRPVANAPLSGFSKLSAAAVLAEIPLGAGDKGPCLGDAAFRKQIAEALADGLEIFLGRR